eukprot:Skav210765  [mRNA]  locus=scaffold3955:72511:74447:- [translate_table: standard]
MCRIQVCRKHLQQVIIWYALHRALVGPLMPKISDDCKDLTRQTDARLTQGLPHLQKELQNCCGQHLREDNRGRKEETPPPNQG